jgi:hypothetical protein
MRMRLAASLICFCVCSSDAAAAPPVELELVTERGVQITAPQEWLQLLTRAGIGNVRIRGAARGEEPSVANRGTAERPRYLVVGILTAREQLRLVGGTFGRGDMGRLKDYFDRLAAEGDERLTAPRGRYGLTEQEMSAVFADLARPIHFATKGLPPRAVLEKVESKFMLRFDIDAEAGRILGSAAPIVDEVKGLTAGTGLAVLLRSYELLLVPEKPRGKPVVLGVRSVDTPTPAQSTIGKTDDTTQPFWPVGWEPERRPRELAPSLFESLSAEIDGYTLDETLAAIGPRLGVPLLVDHAALGAHDIDPAAIKIRLPRTRTYYKRVLDRVLAQARLGLDVRIDEAGTAFLWVTR